MEPRKSVHRVLTMIAKGRELYGRLCAPVCREYGLSQTALDVLLFLANNPENNTARDVCRLRGIKSGIVSVTAEQLIAQGLLARRTDEADRRIRRLFVTEAAAPVVAAGRAAQQAFGRAVAARLTPEERAQLETLTQKLLEGVCAAADTAPEKA